MGRASVLTQTLQAAVNATGNGAVFDTSGLSDVALQISGSFVGTVTFEGSNNGGASWDTVPFYNSAGSPVSTASAPGLFVTYYVGYLLLRARVTWTSGTSVTVTATGTGAG